MARVTGVTGPCGTQAFHTLMAQRGRKRRQRQGEVDRQREKHVRSLKAKANGWHNFIFTTFYWPKQITRFLGDGEIDSIIS